MHVHHAIDAVEAVLQFGEALDGAEIIAEMQVAGRLHAGKHALLDVHYTLEKARILEETGSPAGSAADAAFRGPRHGTHGLTAQGL
ncbi:hypothetical protein GCM10028812_39040 [Ancylobacter sonchi]